MTPPNEPTQRVHRPAMITLGMWGSGLFGAMLLIALLGAAMNVGQFHIGENEVSGHEFIRSAGIPLAIFAAVLLATAYGIVQERFWSRYLMLLFWILAGARAISDMVGARTFDLDLTWVPALVIAAWYLFGKTNVTAYFRMLGRRGAAV